MDEEIIKSPCIRVCKINGNTGYCEGCLRTIDEISDWVFITDEERLKILNEIEERRKLITESKKDDIFS